MATEIAKANAPQLPAALAALKTSIQKTAASLPASGQAGYLSFKKYGAWELGADGEAVTAEDHVAVNVMGVKTGYICWPDDEKQRKNGPLGTVTAPLGQNVDPSTLDRNLAGKWVDYVEMPVKFVGGELDGEEAVYNANSKGGVDAVRGLLDKVVGRLSDGHATFVPLVSLQVDHYVHKTYGKTFFPVLDIVDWVDMDGQGDAAEPEELPTPKRAPSGRGHVAAEEPAAEEPAAEEPAAEAPAAGARRRRRA